MQGPWGIIGTGRIIFSVFAAGAGISSKLSFPPQLPYQTPRQGFFVPAFVRLAKIIPAPIGSLYKGTGEQNVAPAAKIGKYFPRFLLCPMAFAIEKHMPDPMSRCFSGPYFSRITGHWAVTAVWMSLTASSGERSSCSPLCIFFTEHRPFSISSSPRRTA